MSMHESVAVSGRVLDTQVAVISPATVYFSMVAPPDMTGITKADLLALRAEAVEKAKQVGVKVIYRAKTKHRAQLIREDLIARCSAEYSALWVRANKLISERLPLTLNKYRETGVSAEVDELRTAQHELTYYTNPLWKAYSEAKELRAVLTDTIDALSRPTNKPVSIYL